MNHTTAACGHQVTAVGSPGSVARNVVETTPCDTCLTKRRSETLQKFADKAQAFENAIIRDDQHLLCTQLGHDENCIQREGKRDLTKAEKRDGWTMRPFSAYDPQRMCYTCRAYWYACLTTQTLVEAAASARRLEASMDALGGKPAAAKV